jgi:hypothetical protein
MRLERNTEALAAASHGISAAVESESGITPQQIYCLLDLIVREYRETIAEL